MAEIWGAAIAAVVGAGVGLYGANKQSKSQGATNAANTAAIAESDQNAWVNYLLTRGLAVDPNTPTGSLPTNGRATNTRLPLWANLSNTTQPSPTSASMVRRRQPV